MFEVPGSNVKSVYIDDDCVKGLSSAKYERHSDEKVDASSTEDTPASTTSEEEESTKVRVQQ